MTYPIGFGLLEPIFRLCDGPPGPESAVLRGGMRIAAAGGTFDDSAVSRVNAALAARAASEGRRLSLWISAPPLGAGSARIAVFAMILADLRDRRPGEMHVAKPLNGDLLFVTPRITECRQFLSTVCAHNPGSADSVNLVSAYAIESLVRRRVSLDRTLYLASPGRFGESASGAPFGAVLIDASHARLASDAQNILSTISTGPDTAIVVFAPPGFERLAPPGFRFWAWNNELIAGATTMLGTMPVTLSTEPRRHLVVFDADLESRLESVFEVLLMASQERQMPGPWISAAWQLHDRFRQLSVDLALLDRELVVRGQSTTAELLRELDQDPSEGRRSFWALYAERVRRALHDAARHLYTQRNPVKGSAVAVRLGECMEDGTRIRVVVGTSAEVPLLHDRLSRSVPQYEAYIESGAVQIVGASAEHREVVDNEPMRSLLLGARSSSRRFMDLQAPFPVELITFLYETIWDGRSVAKTYSAARPYYTSEAHLKTLRSLDLVSNIPSITTHLPPLTEPLISRTNLDQAPAVRHGIVEALGHTTFIWPAQEQGLGAESFRGSGASASLTDHGTAVIDFDNDETLRVSVSRWLDIWIGERRLLARERAKDVTPGDDIISLRDAPRQTLYQRVREIIEAKRRPAQTLALAFWSTAKTRLMETYEDDYSKIAADLLGRVSVQRETVEGWFLVDTATERVLASDFGFDNIAPRSRTDFDALASLMGPELEGQPVRQKVWLAISQERGARRSLGKRLNEALIRSLTATDEQVNRLAAQLGDAALEQIVASVSVRRVQNMRIEK